MSYLHLLVYLLEMITLLLLERNKPLELAYNEFTCLTRVRHHLSVERA